VSNFLLLCSFGNMNTDSEYPNFEVDENDLFNFEEFCDRKYEDPLVQKLGFFKVSRVFNVFFSSLRLLNLSVHSLLKCFALNVPAGSSPQECSKENHVKGNIEHFQW